ncbi:hypothetical protein [Chryseobacterium daeguense]|uniref:hypothetical protein n=1 Tax=Chryseobacterium daeguense TaxID=412438 RepID=UPI000486EDD2|nr:hypothetical protein [Chryseobacterium daeguense]
MKNKFLSIFFLILSPLYFCQNIIKIEFHHSNAMILFKSVDILFEPIKNNKKEKIKIKVKKDRGEEYFLKIPKEKFRDIYNACMKIKFDTVAVRNMIHGSASRISLYDDLGNNKSYYATGLGKRSKNDKSQKDFWYATKLILKAADLKMEDLISYR